MRLYRNLIISVIVLVALIGTYYFVKNRKVEPDTTEESITLFKTDSNNVISINIKKDTGELTFTKIENEGETDDEKEDKDYWTVNYPYDIKLVQSRITSLVYDVASINASEIIEKDAKDLAKYGLDKPQAIVNVGLKEEDNKTFYIGDKTPIGTEYYFMVENDNNVYTIYSSKGDSILNGLEYYRDKTLVEIVPEEIVSFVIDGEGRRRIEAVKSDEQEEEKEAATGFTLSPWTIVQPYGLEGDSENIHEMVIGNETQTINVDEFVDDNPSDLRMYGLSPAKYTISFTDASGSTTTVHLGNIKNNSMYVKLEGENSVYAVAADKFKFRDIDPFMLISHFAYIVNIDNVDKIEVITDDIHSTLELKREVADNTDKDKEEETESEKEKEDEKEIVTTYLVNGNEIEESRFKTLYQEIIGLIIDGELDKINAQPKGKPTATVIFYHNDGTPDVKMEYMPVDNRNSAVVKNGKSEFYILTKKVNNMIQKVSEFDKN